MKKVIRGKIYDTDTATLIEEHSNGLGDTDNRNCHEELYRKRTGEYFLYGAGGRSTRWRKNVSGSGWGEGASERKYEIRGRGILPLTDADALAWAEEHMSADDIIELFEITEE